MSAPTPTTVSQPATAGKAPKAIASKPSSPKTVAPQSAPQLAAPKTPGPRLYRIMRTGLVVWTLLSAVLCVGSILASQSQQESSASAMVHAQDLRDLRSSVSHAQASALSSLLQASDAPAWKAYEDARDRVDQFMLASAASANSPAEMNQIASAIRHWQDDLILAHQSKLSDNTTLLKDLLDSFTTVTTRIGDAYSSASQGPSTAPFITMGIIASILGGLGFLMVAFATARRSHRVINIGLSIGLLAVIGAIVVVGIYASRSSQISVLDSRISSLSEAEVHTWDSQALAALSVLDVDSWTTHVMDAQSHGGSLRKALSSAGFDLGKPVEGLILRLDQIADATDPDLRTSLVVDSEPWESMDLVLRNAIEAERPSSGSLVVPAMSYVILLTSFCIVAVIAALAGIHTRTKEYV